MKFQRFMSTARVLLALLTVPSTSAKECNLSEAGQCFGNEMCVRTSTSGQWALVFSEACQNCEGGSVENNCNGGLNQCFEDARCQLIDSVNATKICSLENDRECYCQLGDTGKDCNGDEGKCFQDGTMCNFDNGSCVLSADFFACCDVNQGASIENNCNSHLGTCTGRSRCSFSGSLESPSCFIQENSKECFCKGDENNQCGGDLGKCIDGDGCVLDSDDFNACVIEENGKQCMCPGTPEDDCSGRLGACGESGEGRCSVNEWGECKMMVDFTCCREGNGSNNCNGYEMTCDGIEYCKHSADERNVCGIVESPTRCFCRGTPSTNCDGDLDTCLGQYSCNKTDDARCSINDCPSYDPIDLTFCSGHPLDDPPCNGDVGTCSGDNACYTFTENINGNLVYTCEQIYEFTCRFTPAPTIKRNTNVPTIAPTLLPSAIPSTIIWSIAPSTATNNTNSSTNVPSSSSTAPTSLQPTMHDSSAQPSIPPSLINTRTTESPTMQSISFASPSGTTTYAVFFVYITMTMIVLFH